MTHCFRINGSLWAVQLKGRGIRWFIMVLSFFVFTLPPPNPPLVGAVDHLVLGIFEFKNETGDTNYDWLRTAIPESLSSKLSNLPTIRVIERLQIEKLLRENAFQLSGFVDPAQAVTAGKIAGISHAVIGSFQVQGTEILINARVVTVDTGEVSSGTEGSGKLSEIFSLYGNIAEGLISGLGLKPTPAQIALLKRADSRFFDSYHSFTSANWYIYEAPSVYGFLANKFDGGSSIRDSFGAIVAPEFSFENMMTGNASLAASSFAIGIVMQDPDFTDAQALWIYSKYLDLRRVHVRTKLKKTASSYIPIIGAFTGGFRQVTELKIPEGEVREIKRRFTDLFSKDPNNHLLRLYMSWFYVVQEQDFNRAIELLRGSIDIAPQSYAAGYARLLILGFRGISERDFWEKNTDEAIRYSEEVMNTLPSLTYPYFLKGSLLWLKVNNEFPKAKTKRRIELKDVASEARDLLEKAATKSPYSHFSSEAGKIVGEIDAFLKTGKLPKRRRFEGVF